MGQCKPASVILPVQVDQAQEGGWGLVCATTAEPAPLLGQGPLVLTAGPTSVLAEHLFNCYGKSVPGCYTSMKNPIVLYTCSASGAAPGLD